MNKQPITTKRSALARLSKATFTAALLPVLFPFLNTRNSYADSATWKLNPRSGDWHTAANWTPATVPNSETDIATFGPSNLTAVATSVTTSVDSVIFNADASPYILTIGPGLIGFSFWGGGVINNSGIVQAIVLPTISQFDNPRITFRGQASASAGGQVNYVGLGAYFTFLDQATAGNAIITISNAFTEQGNIAFFDSSSAANANITVNSGAFTDFAFESDPGNAVITNNPGGFTDFSNNTGANVTVINTGGTAGHVDGGHITVFYTVNLATATIINRGAAEEGGEGGQAILLGPNGGEAIITNQGGSSQGAGGGLTLFGYEADAAASTLIAHGGVNGGWGGTIQFVYESSGGTARIELDGNGSLDISPHETPDVIVGSLEGEGGEVFLGSHNLAIGSNNVTTIFGGVIQDGGSVGGTGGSISKIGSGVLKLRGANSYTGGTTLEEGGLVISNKTGSGTGTGSVQVNAGTLAGGGIVAGPVTVGTGSGAGAFLAPGQGASTLTRFTVESTLTFKADAIYTYKFNAKKAKADQVVAKGVTIENGAQFEFKVAANKRLPAGQVFRAISNTAAAPISGTFADLADHSIFTAGSNTFQADYDGGDGNDLTLTVVQ